MKVKYLFAVIMAVIMVSCDVIDEPFTEGGSTGGDLGGRIVLLEEYSGVRCNNCPTAALKAEELLNLYGDNLVLMSVHPNNNPLTNPLVDSIDYRVAGSEDWASFFGITGIPKGIVNRHNTQLDSDAWEAAINAELTKPQTVDIDIRNSFRQSDSTLQIKVTSNFLSNLEGDYGLQVCITEDSLVSPQRNNNTAIGEALIDDFSHEHVLRTMVNGLWGETLTEGSALQGQTYNRTYTLTLPEGISIRNCAIVAFVFNKATKEVEQAQTSNSFYLLF